MSEMMWCDRCKKLTYGVWGHEDGYHSEIAELGYLPYESHDILTCDRCGSEDIERANEQITTTPIKGKEYAEVNQRIKAFRMVYPAGYIVTEMLSNENGVCVMQATVGYRDENGDRNRLGTGTAYEKEDSSFINKTSYIENCETSAVGRALGMAGFGIDTSVCSAEELQNALENQGKKSETKPKQSRSRGSEQLTPEEKAELHMRCKALGLDSLKVLGDLGWTEGETVSRQLYERAIKVIEIREKKHTN